MKCKRLLLAPDDDKALSKILMAWGALTNLEYGRPIYSNNALNNLSQLGIKISTSWQNIRWPKAAEAMDQLINELYRVKPKWANAIKWHYTEPGDIRRQAEKQGIAKSTYHERIQKGRDWLAQRWSHFY